MTHSHAAPHAAPGPHAGLDSALPDNPVLARLWRGAWVESQHRGSWVLADTSGRVVEGGGGYERPIFARSSVKSLQALPLIESGAARRFGYGDDELALALSSHNAEAGHTERVAKLLARLGLSVADLRCGPQAPSDPAAKAELARLGAKPTALHNNCSGKHTGFLALAKHLGVAPELYLDPTSEVQVLARRAMAEMSGVQPGELSTAIDGCSAPTFRLPLVRLATAIARVANPEGLAPERRAALEWMHRAVAAHPDMIAGNHKRICTDLVRVSGARLFPKIGGEAVYVVGVRSKGVGLAVKIDDGETRGLHAVVVELLKRFGYLTSSEYDALAAWRGEVQRNWAGLHVGRLEVCA
ncbi:MAG: asparaginase [Planctomycetes bacterium]|nr:asparaginase [Planctomycetota bacterium]